MKLELARRTERFGSVRINDIQRVLLLDSAEVDDSGQTGVCSIPRNQIQEIERKMAIVIPIKNERLKVLEGVISAIPGECLIIIVSNSNRDGVDRFKMELDMVEQHVHYTRREVWMVHQEDPQIGRALKRVNYKDLFDVNGGVRDGKAEGMVIGMLLAKAAEKEYIGFVDADNYVPGAVHEYVNIYSAAFHLSQTPYSMVRISWAYKPKILEGSLYFSRWGRVSSVTNKYLNILIGSYTGFETEVIKTGNSGDHAMTMKLAEILNYKSSFAVEPGEILNILEQFGGVIKPRFREPMEKGVEIFQIETQNPHFHEEKGEEHLIEMLSSALTAIFQSPLCPEHVKKQVEKERPEGKFQTSIKENEMKSFQKINVKLFLNHLHQNNSIFILGKKVEERRQ